MDRLILKLWTPSDREDWRRLGNDPRVAQYMGDGRVDPVVTERLFEKILELDCTEGGRFLGLWAVWEGDRLVGHAELKRTENTGRGEVEVVYMLAPEVWGRGLGTELVQALLAVAREHAQDVIATVHPDNGGSLKVLERVGFTTREQRENGTIVLFWKRAPG